MTVASVLMLEHQPVSTACFSPCRHWRYTLERIWGDGPLVNFVMLNPSKADEVNNDPTVERQRRRVIRWRQRGVNQHLTRDFGGIIVTNIFAWRSTDPSALYKVEDPIGEENDKAIVASALRSDMVICAWGGTHGTLRGRGNAVRDLLTKKCGMSVHYLRMCDNGHPSHPLYLPYSLEPQAWRVG